MNYLPLVILGGFFLNLPLQMGLGAHEIFFSRNDSLLDALFESILLFFTLLFEWALFTFVFSPLTLGFFKYFLILPLGAVVPSCLRLAAARTLPSRFALRNSVYSFPYMSGANVAALLVMLGLATTGTEALVLAAGFSSGVFISMTILRAIRFRIDRERINPLIRGTPLLLIAMGLLSLAVMSVAIIYLK
jgi:electron transport complex protein RnfA